MSHDRKKKLIIKFSLTNKSVKGLIHPVNLEVEEVELGQLALFLMNKFPEDQTWVLVQLPEFNKKGHDS